MLAATIETLPRVGEGNLRDLTAKTGKEALPSSRMRAAHVAMATKGKAFGLAGVMLVDRNLDECEYGYGDRRRVATTFGDTETSCID
jgi:hypothetical protein